MENIIEIQEFEDCVVAGKIDEYGKLQNGACFIVLDRNKERLVSKCFTTVSEAMVWIHSNNATLLDMQGE